MGLSNNDENKNFYYFKGGSVLASQENLIDHDNTEKVQCTLKKLDNNISSLKVKAIDFMKIDVEGGELNVLLGSLNTIKSYNPIILIELLTLRTGSRTFKFLELFKGCLISGKN